MSRYRRYLSFVRDSLVQHRKGPQLTRVVSTIDGTVLGAGVAVRAVWVQRQLESSTIGADFEVQLLPPVPVQVFQLILGCVSVVEVPGCWARTALSRVREVRARDLYILSDREETVCDDVDSECGHQLLI